MYRFVLIAVVLPTVWNAFTKTAQGADRPNIVIILVDDMGFSDVGCYGGEIETPNLDRLAAGGLRFTQFYNCGRCCPTRASLMTGLHPHQVGIGHMTAPPDEPLGIEGPYQGFLNDRCVTLGQVLQSSGYHTMITGKWHLGVNDRSCWPLQRGFEKYYGGLSGAFNYFKPGGNRRISEGNEIIETGDDFYTTDTFTDKACQYISDAVAEDDRPFFLYLAYNAPHWPLNAKWDDFQKYKGRYRDGWLPMMQARQAKQKELGLFEYEIEPAPYAGPAWESLNDQQRDNLDTRMAAYAGCIDSIDQNVGKLIARLQTLDELDNTLIFFLSDNGACQEGGRLGSGDAEMVKNPPLETTNGITLGLAWAGACNTPFRLYKHFVHEGGACTPMIAHWPRGIPREREGSYVRQLGYLPDFMATCIELSGATYPAGIPACVGSSLVPLLRGNDQTIHDGPVFWEHEGNAAVRSGRWKLVREYNKPWELYDLQTDRTELHDLASAHPERRDELGQAWEAWARAHGVSFPERFDMYQFLQKK